MKKIRNKPREKIKWDLDNLGNVVSINRATLVMEGSITILKPLYIIVASDVGVGVLKLNTYNGMYEKQSGKIFSTIEEAMKYSG